MYFDGLVAKIGFNAGVYIISPLEESESLSYQLNIECTNNVAEYKAFLLGLHSLKSRKSRRIKVIGDLKLVINQINDIY